jgi:hypothetical protein
MNIFGQPTMFNGLMERQSAAEDHHSSVDPAGTRAIERRDSAMGLVSRLNRWLIAGAASAAGLLSFAAAQAFHGHTVTRGAASGASTGGQQSQAASSSGVGAFGSPAPAPAPAAAGTGPVVMSGGS